MDSIFQGNKIVSVNLTNPLPLSRKALIKQTTKFKSANSIKMFHPSYFVLRLQRLKSKHCKNRSQRAFGAKIFTPNARWDGSSVRALLFKASLHLFIANMRGVLSLSPPINKPFPNSHHQRILLSTLLCVS